MKNVNSWAILSVAACLRFVQGRGVKFGRRRLNGRQGLVRLLIKTCLPAATLIAAHAATILTFFPASDYNANTSIMNTTLGIGPTDTIDSFESTTLIPGLTITLSGGVTATTWMALPSLSNQNSCGAPTWDGMFAATNSVTNLLNSCTAPTPSDIAQMTTFNYAPGTTFFGIGLANFQSLDSSAFPETNHELFVNGVDLGVLETLFGDSCATVPGPGCSNGNWSPGTGLNGYLEITATGGSSITSVGFEDLTRPVNPDFLVFDHLAVVGQSGGIPEPGSGWLLFFGVVPVAFRLFRRAR